MVHVRTHAPHGKVHTVHHGTHDASSTHTNRKRQHERAAICGTSTRGAASHSHCNRWASDRRDTCHMTPKQSSCRQTGCGIPRHMRRQHLFSTTICARERVRNRHIDVVHAVEQPRLLCSSLLLPSAALRRAQCRRGGRHCHAVNAGCARGRRCDKTLGGEGGGRLVVPHVSACGKLSMPGALRGHRDLKLRTRREICISRRGRDERDRCDAPATRGTPLRRRLVSTYGLPSG